MEYGDVKFHAVFKANWLITIFSMSWLCKAPETIIVKPEANNGKPLTFNVVLKEHT